MFVHYLLYRCIYSSEEENIPQDFKDAYLIHINKRKGNRRCCDNHHGISLLSIAGKILARVLLNRLLDHLESGLLPESQCGFHAGRGTVDMIFAARQLQEKCWEQHQDLYTTFVDLTKAFDTVSHAGLWNIMAKYGCPDKFIALVRQFHDGMLVRVTDDGDSSEPVAVTNGAKQGCVLAPTLFSIMFSAMLLRPSEMLMMALQYSTVWMENFSTYGDSRPNLKWRKLLFGTCSLLTTVLLMPALRLNAAKYE